MPRVTNKKKPKKTNKKTKIAKHAKVEQKEQDTKDEKFSFENEIVIGLRRIDDEPKEVTKNKKKKSKKTKSSKEKSNQKNTKPKTKAKSRDKKQPDKEVEDQDVIIKSKYMQNYEETEENNEHQTKQKSKTNNKNNKKRKISNSKPTNTKLTKKQQAQKKRRKRIIKVVKWLTLIGIIIAGIIYAMLSPIFNIKNITVSGNAKISSETIISLSGLNIEQNIFNFRTSNITDNIKQNAYIDSVEIRRQLPDEVQIVVQERVAKYMLTLGNAYVYINNQGYIL